MRFIECRSVKETAVALGISDRTVEGDWALWYVNLTHPVEAVSDCDSNGVPGGLPGDHDADGDVDLDDFGRFEECMAGPGAIPNPVNVECVGLCMSVYDFATDNDVDLADLAVFQLAFTGP